MTRRNIGLALGMIAAVLLTAGAMIASTARKPVDPANAISIEAVPVASDTDLRRSDSDL